MLQIIDRRSQALGTQGWNRPESQITAVAWHYTGVARRNRSFITNHERYWRNTLGWNRGGYHYYIDADGKIYQNYNLTTQTNGVGMQNHYTVHISVEANSASDYSPAQIKARQELTLYLMKRLNITSNRVMGHKEFPGQSTSCPGYTTAQMNSYRSQLARGSSGNVTTVAGKKEPAVTPRPTGQRLHLPSNESSWSVYRTGGPYTSGNHVGKLNPQKFGGLSYDIVGNPVANVYLINTDNFGTVAIYAHKDTGATITGSGAGSAKPQPSSANGKTLKLPASATTWKIYNPNGPYTSGNHIHELTPSVYGGLEYEIKGNPAPDVYLIDTGVKGRVAIYASSSTGATVVSDKIGWIEDSIGWWYKNPDGSYPRSNWKNVNDRWYHFDSRGYMQSGWKKIGSAWYYMNSSGVMQTGWTLVGETWYYLNSSGEMQTGWKKVDSKWYYMNSNGAMQTGWVKVGNRWFYMSPSGAMQTGLITIEGGQYYLKSNGAMAVSEGVTLRADKNGRLR